MYILALKNVQLKLEAGPYIVFRRLTDASMRRNLRFVIYAALLANLILVISTIKNQRGWLIKQPQQEIVLVKSIGF